MLFLLKKINKDELELNLMPSAMKKHNAIQDSFDGYWLSNISNFIKTQWEAIKGPSIKQEQEQEYLFFALFTANQKNITK